MSEARSMAIMVMQDVLRRNGRRVGVLPLNAALHEAEPYLKRQHFEEFREAFEKNLSGKGYLANVILRRAREVFDQLMVT